MENVFMADQEDKGVTLSSRGEAPTPASLWYSLAGSPITEEFLDWPADMFALTEVILDRSQLHRFVLSPPRGRNWPPSSIPCWHEAVEEAGRQWSRWIQDRKTGFPDLLAEEWRAFNERAEMSLENLAEGRDWRMCEALLTLHAIADEACAGLGSGVSGCERKACVYRARGRELLARTGSLARIQSQFVRVLPKVCSARRGTSLRSLSRYVCLHGQPVECRWHKVPARRGGTEPRARHLSYLLLPWPLRVRESDFRPVEGSVERYDEPPFGYFEFAPSEKLDLDLVHRAIVAAKDEVDSVDAVLLPESAVDESDIDDLEALLTSHGVIALVAGVRERTTPSRRLPANWVHTGINPRLDSTAPMGSVREQWFHVRQNKHHPWSLDENQIYQYHLGGALHPRVSWWEAIEVPRQTIHFQEFGDEFTTVSLVCEDLAQIDSVAEVIRAVGPTLVFTPLLDGPQLSSRWAARYASVLADDPGAAVLTLTSYGMVKRCRPHGRDSSAVVALWKDPVGGLREIPLEPGAQGILLTVCNERASRRTSDGRWPVDNATHHFDVAVYQVRASSAGSTPSRPQSGALAPRTLECEDLTILTGWAQVLAEAIAHEPECIEALMADAKGNTPWRATFGIPAPSSQLSRAISFLDQAVHAVTSLSGNTTLDEVRSYCLEDTPAEDVLDRLARKVLRLTLESVRTR